MKQRLSQLMAQLEQWNQQAQIIDQQKNIDSQAWFDPHLFNADRRQLAACVQETQQNLTRLQHLTQTKMSTPNTNQIAHLTEHLFAQIEALHRVITHGLDTLYAESKRFKMDDGFTYALSKEALQHQFVKHQEWEQRLRQLVLNKQYEFDHAPARYHTSRLQALTVAKQRLIRCQQAKAAIEAQLLNDPRN